MSRTQKSLSRALERLSTGKRVNSPRDDFAGFSSAVRLDSQIRGLRQANLNLNSARGLLGTAENALSSLTEIVQKLRELSVQLGSGVLQSGDRNSIQTQMQSLISEYQRILSATEFSGLNPLNSEGNFLEIQSGANSGESLALELDDLSASKVFVKNEGLGIFKSSVSYDLTENAGEKAVYDLDGDGDLDMALSSGSEIQIYLNDGDSGFSLAKTFAITGSVSDIIFQDGNDDGLIDLVYQDTNGLQFRSGQGGDSFSAAKDLGGVSVGRFSDVNNDGKSELLGVSGSTVGVFELDENMNPTLDQDLATTGAYIIESVALADLDGDGDKDFVFTSSFGVESEFGVFENRSGEFILRDSGASTLAWESELKVADIDNDGDDEILTGNGGVSAIGVYDFNESLELQDLGFNAVGFTVFSVEVDDVNNDGNLDLVSMGATLGIFLGDGTGSFSLSRTQEILLSSSTDLILADLDGDSVADILHSKQGGFGPDGFEFRKGSSREVSALLEAQSSATDTKVLLSVFDRALEKINSARVNIGAQISQLENRLDSNLLTSENLSEAKSLIEDADLAQETSRLVAAQILQQSQIGAFSQSNLNLQVVLQIFDSLG